MKMNTPTHVAIPVDLADRIVTYLSDRSAVAERLLQAIQGEGVALTLAEIRSETESAEDVASS